MTIYKNFPTVTAGIIIMLAISGFFLFTNANSTPLHAELTKADSYFKEKSYKLAREAYDELYSSLNKKQQKVDVLYKTAFCSFMLRDYKDAQKRLDSLTEMKPEGIALPRTKLLQAQIYSNTNNYGYHEKILALLAEAEKLLLNYSKSLTRENLRTLYSLELNTLYVRRYQNKQWVDKAQIAINNLLKYESSREEQAKILMDFADKIRYSSKDKLDLFTSTLKRVFDHYKETKYAPAAMLQLALLYESEEKYDLALKYTKLIKIRYRDNTQFVKHAKLISDRITLPQMTVAVPKIYQPSDDIMIKLSSRNVKDIRFRLYAVHLEKVFRELKTIEYVDKYRFKANDILIKEWNFPTQDKNEHHILHNDLKLDLNAPGAFILHASANGVELKALVMVTDIALVVKRSGSRNLFFVTDASTGNPVNKADVIVGYNRTNIRIENRFERYESYNSYKTILSRKTNDAGTLLLEYPKKGNFTQILAIAKRKNSYALSQSWQSRFYGSQGQRAYIYTQTDRPVYRPDQEMNFKATIRTRDKGIFKTTVKYDVEAVLHNSKGNKLKTYKLKTNEFGSVSGKFKFPEDASLGQYYIIFRSSGQTHYQYFRVEEYKKPEFTVEIKTAESQYRLGKIIKADIVAKYYFGEAVKNAEVKYRIYREYYYPYYNFPYRYSWFYSSSGYDGYKRADYRRGRPHAGNLLVKDGTGKTDELGKLAIEFPAEPAANDNRAEKYYRYRVDAEVTDKSRRMIQGQSRITVGDKAFKVYLRPQKWLYSPKDRVKIMIASQNLNGEPVGATGTLILEEAKYNRKSEKYDFKRIDSWKVKTDKKGKVEHTETVKNTGYYRWTYRTADKYDKMIEGHCWVWVSDKSFRGTFYKYQGLEIVTDKESYTPGENANILINSDVLSNSTVLLTTENQELFDYRIIKLNGNSRMVNLKIKEGYTPNIWIKLIGVMNFKTYQADKQVIIPPDDKFLDIKVYTDKETFLPGETAELRLKVTDKRGKPVSAEIALGVVDSSIYYIAPDTTPDIRKYFYGNMLPNNVRLATSFDFRYRAFSNKSFNYTGYDGFRGAQKVYAESSRESMALGDAAAPAPMAKMRTKSETKKRNGGKDKDLAEPKVRKDFRDTAYWAPFITTGRDGTAKVKIKFPESLTTWKLTGRALTKNTLVGNESMNIITRKNVMIRLQTPRFMTERDRVIISGNIHNYLKQAVKAQAELKVKGLKLTGDSKKWIDIESGDDKRADFEVIAEKPGEAVLTAYARTDIESDAMQLKIPVIVHGVHKRFTENGKVKSTSEVKFNLPADRKKETTRLVIGIAPSIAGVLLDSLEYLVKYPYGCVEQTMSRFMPAVITARTLKDLGAQNKKLEEKLPKVVKAGLKRLYDFQHSDGGWGWWKNDSSSPYMTGYVYYGLALAEQAGYKIDSNRMKRAENFLMQKIKYSSLDLNNMVFAIHAVSLKATKDKNFNDSILKIYEKRQELNAYSRALLATALSNLGEKDKAAIMLRNLFDFSRVDKKNGTISWAENQRYWWYWYNDSVESTAAALRAYLKIDPRSPYVPMAVKWLVENRKGARWKSTRDTAFAILALTDYIKSYRELQPEYTASVKINGKLLKKWNISSKDAFDYGKEIVLSDKDLSSGGLDIQFIKDGKGEMYYSATLEYFTKEEDLKGVAHGITANREYFKVSRNGNKETIEKVKYGETLNSGDELEVVITIDADNNYEYLVFEDYKPSGTEPFALVSGYTWEGRLGMQREIRDEKVAFFINWLPQGKHQIKYRIRAEIPGDYHAMPTKGYAMYSPKIYTLSNEFRMSIRDKSEVKE